MKLSRTCLIFASVVRISFALSQRSLTSCKIQRKYLQYSPGVVNNMFAKAEWEQQAYLLSQSFLLKTFCNAPIYVGTGRTYGYTEMKYSATHNDETAETNHAGPAAAAIAVLITKNDSIAGTQWVSFFKWLLKPKLSSFHTQRVDKYVHRDFLKLNILKSCK